MDRQGCLPPWRVGVGWISIAATSASKLSSIVFLLMGREQRIHTRLVKVITTQILFLLTHRLPLPQGQSSFLFPLPWVRFLSLAHASAFPLQLLVISPGNWGVPSWPGYPWASRSLSGQTRGHTSECSHRCSSSSSLIRGGAQALVLAPVRLTCSGKGFSLGFGMAGLVPAGSPPGRLIVVLCFEGRVEGLGPVAPAGVSQGDLWLFEDVF